MIKNKQLAITLAVSFLTYIVSDYLFNDAVFYIAGGILGSATKAVSIENGFLFVWAILLAGLILLLYKVINNTLRYIIIALLWVFLYFIDAILYEFLPAIECTATNYLHILLAVLLKGFSLALLIYNTGVRLNQKQ